MEFDVEEFCTAVDVIAYDLLKLLLNCIGQVLNRIGKELVLTAKNYYSKFKLYPSGLPIEIGIVSSPALHLWEAHRSVDVELSMSSDQQLQSISRIWSSYNIRQVVLLLTRFRPFLESVLARSAYVIVEPIDTFISKTYGKLKQLCRYFKLLDLIAKDGITSLLADIPANATLSLKQDFEKKVVNQSSSPHQFNESFLLIKLQNMSVNRGFSELLEDRYKNRMSSTTYDSLRHIRSFFSNDGPLLKI